MTGTISCQNLQNNFCMNIFMCVYRDTEKDKDTHIHSNTHFLTFFKNWHINLLYYSFVCVCVCVCVCMHDMYKNLLLLIQIL